MLYALRTKLGRERDGSVPWNPRGFDERLWFALVDHATVHPDGSISVMFKNGQEMRAGE